MYSIIFFPCSSIFETELIIGFHWSENCYGNTWTVIYEKSYMQYLCIKFNARNSAFFGNTNSQHFCLTVTKSHLLITCYLLAIKYLKVHALKMLMVEHNTLLYCSASCIAGSILGAVAKDFNTYKILFVKPFY